MESAKSRRATKAPPPDSTAAVDAFMSTLEHPFRAEIELLREILLGADPAVAEGIKWNAPSFRTSGYFATTHLRGKGTLGLILHLGAKARALPAAGLAVADPTNLLKWLAADRAMVEFSSRAEIEAARSSLTALVQEWIRHV